MTATSQTLLFLGTQDDTNHLPRLKPMCGVATVFVLLAPVTTLAEVILYCKKRNISGVLTTNKIVLSKLLSAIGNPKGNPSLDQYAGSYFKHQDIEFVILNPLEQLVTIPYAPFITRRFVSKLTAPETWAEVPEFKWDIITASNWEPIFDSYKSAYAIAVDIETIRDPLKITFVGYTAIFISGGSIRTHSSVIKMDSSFALGVVRKFNWELQAQKIFQNGKYDCSYLSRYNAVPYNYLWDTANLFHCWYSELPKDLAFMGSFFVRKAMYWKDLADTTDEYEYCKYNALDTWTTANVWIAQMLQMPQWARNNYLLEFPLVFPCHLSEMTGIKRDMDRLNSAAKEAEDYIEAANISLSKMVGTYPRIYNTNSVTQNKALRTILGCGDYNSSDENHLKKIGARHPLNKRIANKILDIRGFRKLASTYLTVNENAKEFCGRILYSLNPHGTDTSRLASREHHFWCGLQVQNIPREAPETPSVKSTLVADDGFMLAECDLEQAESRDTAFIAGDEKLIAAVTGTRDFHSVNASAFFGISYEDLYDDTVKKSKNKKIRGLAKRVNHGANYLMGESVLADTMGEENVWEAKRLLHLPSAYGILDVTRHLLENCFHTTYTKLRGTFYPGVVEEVLMTKMIQHKIMNADGTDDPARWTRYCFGNPKVNKLHKNALVAHVPQSLNAQTLNKAYLKVFYDIAIHPTHSKNFKLCAQIHDSILFQFRIGHEYLCDMVRERMEIPVTIRGYDGKIRTFTVPAAIKAGKDGKGAKYWSDTE